MKKISVLSNLDLFGLYCLKRHAQINRKFVISLFPQKMESRAIDVISNQFNFDVNVIIFCYTLVSKGNLN